MVSVGTNRNKLIQILSKQKDRYISGQEISNALNISRNSVWKHMKALEKDGFVIEGVPKKGYRILEQPNKVSDNTIKWGLETNWLAKHIIYQATGTSTQDLIHEHAREGGEHGTVAILDEQTKGKGRMNRNWHSADKKGMWLSILLRPEMPPQHAAQLTLLTAAVLATVLKENTTVDPLIKWPNDLLIERRKVAGILTEMQAEQDQIQYIVIGIGLNINHQATELPTTESYQATSLYQETGKTWSISNLIQQFLHEFEHVYDNYMVNGFAPVKKTWESFGFKMGEKISIKNPKEERQAIFHGIAEDGALLILNDTGEKERVYSGEIDWFAS
jgi:BirA family biotin operon repressor/biotin-[acetyl-CoA-carboxylase] ligase